MILMTQSLAGYVVSFQAERFYKRTRYHWMICKVQNPDELVSWGHAATQELAEKAAQNQVEDLLSSALTQGARVTSMSKSATTNADWHSRAECKKRPASLGILSRRLVSSITDGRTKLWDSRFN